MRIYFLVALLPFALVLLGYASALSSPDPKPPQLQKDVRRAFLASSLAAATQLVWAKTHTPTGFQRIPTQFIAALGDPDSNTGSGDQEWGIWEKDPGPRGVWLSDYTTKLADGQAAPAGWRFDPNDWWLEEHGLIMESPQFPLKAGRYLVTGGRWVTTVLSVGEDGRWELDDGKLYDVTHLPCRSARYHPSAPNGGPLTARASDFPVQPGAEMPAVDGCSKQDYAVLFVIGVEA